MTVGVALFVNRFIFSKVVMVEIDPRVNLYLFSPHPAWRGAVGSVVVAARDFQRAEGIALREARKRGIPGISFSIITEEFGEEESEGRWVEIERYRDVEDVERLIFFEYGQSVEEVLEPASFEREAIR